MGCDIYSSKVQPDRDVSIHAPTWDATNLSGSIGSIFSCFNPRTHMGCDKKTHYKSG